MSDLQEKIQKVLDTEIRPALQMDGGDAQLVSVNDGVVEVKLTGACGGCPMSAMTFVGFVEERLKAAFPEIKEVVPAG